MLLAALLSTILALGLIAAGLTSVIRAVVPQSFLLIRPFSCDLCMSWWSSLVGATGLVLLDQADMRLAVASVLGAVAVSVLVLKKINRLSE